MHCIAIDFRNCSVMLMTWCSLHQENGMGPEFQCCSVGELCKWRCCPEIWHESGHPLKLRTPSIKKSKPKRIQKDCLVLRELIPNMFDKTKVMKNCQSWDLPTSSKLSNNIKPYPDYQTYRKNSCLRLEEISWNHRKPKSHWKPR